VELFYATAWKVHHNSNRLGYRLIGPAPRFARTDGGEGGRHPSNIHDCAYAIGTVNFTGDVPIILTADGPSLGGFVSIATVVAAELWKVGQARANDTIRFRRLTTSRALGLRRRQERLLRDLAAGRGTTTASAATPNGRADGEPQGGRG
jgi:urea carboxylase